MDGTATAARQHIDLMQARIAQQTALIVELRQSGQDTLEATRRLALLHHALEEMRILLGDMVPTEARIPSREGPERRKHFPNRPECLAEPE